MVDHLVLQVCLIQAATRASKDSNVTSKQVVELINLQAEIWLLLQQLHHILRQYLTVLLL